MEAAKNLAENPNTAIASESESEPQTPHRTPTKRRKKRRGQFVPNFNLPGVHKVILPEHIQKSIGCVAGETVTAEKPWMRVKKELIMDQLDMHVESSEFLPFKNRIEVFADNEILMGYIPDESNDYDEFYVCITEDATRAVDSIIKKMKKIQDHKLNNAINKKIKRWRTLGSEKEIEEVMVRYKRSLIEVEIESKYPILPFKVQFRLVKAQDLRDGYMELRPFDDGSTIFRRRIDAGVQVTPSVHSNEAQTVCTYPKNSYTQYEYELPEATFQGSMNDFVTQNLDSFCDILRVNGCIDLYSNDYENLVLDNVYGTKITIPEYKEYFCFIDMNLCRGKMISSISWHPMWTGCVIASYVDVAPSLYLTEKKATDEIFKAIHDTNPVLFWSFADDLKPRLILETPRPIYALSCCPHDQNLIIGGCSNGQIILWDITQRLNNVEEEEILSVHQQKYRDYMFSLMNWMKNIFDLALVRPTAVSNLKFSHRGCVNSITWMSPFHSVSKTGKIQEINRDAPHSLVFLTSSEDGSIMIWDLLMKPVITAGGFKAIRKLKRLTKRPSALSVMESPFKKLHLNLKPIYKINIVSPMENSRLLSVSSCYMKFFKTVYEPATRVNIKTLKLSDRVVYKPVLNIQNSIPKKSFFVGTMEGDYIHGSWDGQEFDSGEVVNYENCDFVNSGKYHDGPIVKIDYAASFDTILTVGGKIFALWREPFKNRPILWRKSASVYTHGAFFEFDEASIKLTRMDGNDEVWTLFYQSKEPLSTCLMSNGAITMASTHPRKLKNNVIAMCDYRGSLRMFYRQHMSQSVIRTKEDAMSDFVTREIIRKNAFLQWQTKWNERYKAATEVVETKEEVVFEESKPKRREEKKKVVKISPGQRYLEMVQEQHRVNEQARIKSIILMKKQLNTEDLLKKREPLRKLEEENEFKKRKQKNKHRESDKIFKDQVAMLFPDVVKVKPAPPPNPYEDCYDDDFKKISFDGYHPTAISAQDYVEEHPFSYDFSWVSVLRAGRERRKKLDEATNKHGHRRRYENVKKEKEAMLNVIQEVKQEVTVVDDNESVDV